MTLHPTPEGASPAVLPPRFVGRERELRALAQALGEPPAMVIIEGEAGIGKSRLLAEYLATEPGQKLLVAGCPPFRQPQTLGPVVDAVRAAAGDVRGLGLSPLAGALRPMFPEWEADLPPAPEPAEDATAARHRLFRALEELLGRLDIAGLAVEDVHWADEATLEFLMFLAFRQPRPVSLVLTYRPFDVPPGSLLPRLTSRLPPGTTQLRLTLGMLDVDTTGELVSSMLEGERVSAQFAVFVHERTEGIPLAIEETIRLLAARADLRRRGSGWIRRNVAGIAVPASIRDAVLERAGRLDEQAQAVLRAIAVLADPADETTLSAVAGLPAAQVRAGLSEVVRAGLVQADRRALVSFRHVLAARATYDAIPVPLRRELHRRAGLALEGVSPGLVAQLARHFRDAGENSAWCRYAERAAELAAASGDEATAMTLAGELMTDAGADGREAAARILDRLSSLAESGRHLESLRQALNAVLGTGSMTRAEEAVWRFHLGRVLAVLDEWESSRAEMERAIPHLAHEPARAARAMSLLAFLPDTSTPAAVHLRWLERVAEVTATTTLTPVLRLRLLVERTACLLLMGDNEGWAEAARIPPDADTPEERLVITLGHQNNGDQSMLWGRYGDAARSLAVARKLAQTHSYVRYEGNTEITQAHLDWFTGAWQGLAERVRALAENVLTQPGALLEADLVTGLLHATLGEQAPAEERLRAALTGHLRRGAPAYAMEPAGALAWLYLRDQRAPDALEVTSELAAIAVVKNFWVSGAELAPAHVAVLTATGRAAQAEDYVTRFGRGLRGTDSPAARAALAMCRAIVADAGADHGQAGRLFARAAATWDALPRPYAALLARERQARCLLAAGDLTAGRTLLADVLAGLSGLGAADAAARVARVLRENGVPARRPGAGRPSYHGQLSPREREVVSLIAAGHTNRQIADSLFLSPKTVATHVNAAMRKLGVTTRTALAVAALTSGIVSPGRQ
jgi:DNA-binding CsgD family transcriptional regulator